jgi:hypothetical protein
VAVNLPHRNRKDVLPEERILQTLTEVIRGVRRDRVSEPIGIMTHHWGVDGEVRQFLQKVFSLTRDAGGTWTSSAELFTQPPATCLTHLRRDPGISRDRLEHRPEFVLFLERRVHTFHT